MKRNIWALGLVVFLLASLVAPALASPPYPEGADAPFVTPEDTLVPTIERTQDTKPIDQPNAKDYLRNQQRLRLLEAGQTAEAAALDLTGTDRVLVILVEFAGTDVFTWNPGDAWDPIGYASEDDYTGALNDCSNIITTTQTFTYTGPLHNEIPRPLSADDRSGDTIWTEDFSNQWFDDFMFGDGIVFDYTRVDSSTVYEDFTGQSVTHYYEDLSQGDYHVTGDVIGWLQLPHSTWWYGADGCPGARSVPSGATRPANSGAIPGAGNSRTLVMDALDAVNAISDTIPGFDWANYDQDSDGIIDRLWVVHAGYGEEDGTTLLNRTDYGEASMWSHSSSVSPAYPVAPGIAAGPYIMMPENGGIGVFAHEYGHNLGADDLYAYGAGETSAGFWTLMSDDWTGYPIGFEPPSVDPWHLDNWGWLDPMVVTDTAQVYTVTLGQGSYFSTNTAMGDAYRGVKIELPDGLIPLSVPVWQGSYYWWGGAENQANGMMTSAGAIDLTTATTASLSFDLVYDIEDEWDFLWVQVSTDGVTWPYSDTLTNGNTQCIHNVAWIGGLNGFPDDLCGAGIGGFYGYNVNWPDPELQTFDLTPYVGQQIWLRLWYMTDWGTLYTGAFVDNVSVDTDGGNVFFDDAEAGDANWTYAFPWVRSNGNSTYSHNLYLQWRNTNENGGYDSGLGDPRYRFGPANTGLLVWYNNNFYRDNEVWDHLFDDPSLGAKGRMLVLDSHPEPDRDPYLVGLGYDNEGGNVTSRSLMRDAPFTLMDTVSYTLQPPYATETTLFAGRPAVSSFHDALGYNPGAEYVRRGPAYDPTQFKWLTKQWDSSGVVPATSAYPLSAVGYDGTGANPSSSDREFRFRCTPILEGVNAGFLSCYWFGTGVGLGYEGGTGNPGDDGLQYGWHVELIEEAADHTWATVRIWNAMYEVMDDLMAEPDMTTIGHQIDYSYDLDMNVGSPLAQALVIVPMTDTVKYVAGSASGFMPLPVGMSADQAASIYAQGGKEALEQLAVGQTADVGALAWLVGGLTTGEGAGSAGFSVEVMVNGPDMIELEAMVFNGANWVHTTEANPVTVYQSFHTYLPLVMKSQ